MNDIVTRLLTTGGSIVVNKALIQSLGIKNAIILGELLSKFYYWKDRGILTRNGYFYCTIDDLQISTGLAKKAQSNAIEYLVNNQMMSTYVYGMPPKRYFTFTNEHIDKIVEKLKEGQSILDEHYKGKMEFNFPQVESISP